MTARIIGVLVLGGTAAAKQLATTLSKLGFGVIYSIAGLVRQTVLDCEVRVGGFSHGHDAVHGASGMARFIEARGIRLLIDATHPYATQISANAARAAQHCNIRCWRVTRAGFSEHQKGVHQSHACMQSLIGAIQHLRRPLFATGKSQLQFVAQQPPQQHWIIRTAVTLESSQRYTIVPGIGPFCYADEVALMRAYRIDGLVAKDGGSPGVLAKFRAAHDLGLPVYILRRPQLAAVDLEFTTVHALITAIGAISDL